LAEAAAEIASESSNRKTGTSREKMIQWLLFYRVDVHGNGFGIDMAIQYTAQILAHPTDAEFTLGDFAMLAAKITMQASVS
jgi:hypothetical protein